MFKRSSSGGDSAATASHSPSETADGVVAINDAAPPTAGGHAHGGDETVAAVRKTKLGSFALLAIVLGVSALLLVSMRKLGVSQRIEMPDIKIDYPIEQADVSVLKKDHEKIIKALNRTGEVVQVPLDQVQMNPFALPVASASPTAASGKPELSDGDRAAAAKTARYKEAEAKLKSLKLNSVLAGKVPVAQISGQVVRVGDIVAELFIVGKIQGRSVTLVSDGNEFELSLVE